MILIPRGDRNGKMSPGRWRPLTSDGKLTASLSCPKCGDQGALRDHEIGMEGDVTPSVMCNACDYHESGLRLDGWTQAISERAVSAAQRVLDDARVDPEIIRKPTNI